MLLHVGKKNLCIVIIMLGLSCGHPAWGDSDPVWTVPGGPSHEPVPYHYEPGILKNVPKEFLEDAPACILYSGVTNIVEPDGTVETTTHEITRLNSRKSLEKLGEYRSITYASAIGFQHTGFVQGDLFKGRIVSNAAVFAEFLQALAAIEASDLVSGCFDRAVRLDNIGDAAVEDASRRVFEKLLGNVF